MCVIAVSPAGNPMPTKEDIKKMFDRNPDGAGFAIDKGEGVVEFHKGYMDLKSFMDKLDEYTDLKSPAVTMHFRIKTKGQTDQKTTHPFIISSDFGKMRKLHGMGKFNVMFHNGTFIEMGGILSPLSSDSQDFAAGPALLLMNNKKKINKIKAAMFKQMVGNSRVVIMRGNGEPERFGNGWVTHTDGNSYSNMAWNAATTYAKPITYSKPVTTPATNVTRAIPQKAELTQSKTEDPDGKHCFPGVWPAPGREWIEFSNDFVTKSAINQMITRFKDGRISYLTRTTPSMEYFKVNENTIATHEGLKRIAQTWARKNNNQASEEYLQDLDDGILSFSDIDSMATITDSFEYDVESGAYLFRGEEWYADYHNIELYSKEFIKAFFDDYHTAIVNITTFGTLSEDAMAWEDDDEEEIIKAIQQMDKAAAAS